MSRVKEPGELVRLRINPRDVRALVQITPRAAQGQVFERRAAAVLTSDDVIQYVSEV